MTNTAPPNAPEASYEGGGGDTPPGRCGLHGSGGGGRGEGCCLSVCGDQLVKYPHRVIPALVMSTERRRGRAEVEAVVPCGEEVAAEFAELQRCDMAG